MGGASGRFAESEGGRDGGLGGRSNFYNSKRENDFGGEDTPYSSKTDGNRMDFGTPVLHNFRNNSKKDEDDSKKYSQTPNPGYDDKHRNITSMADHNKKTALKTNSTAFYQPQEGAHGYREERHQGGGYKEASNKPRQDNYYNDNEGSSHSYPSPNERPNQTPTGRQFR